MCISVISLNTSFYFFIIQICISCYCFNVLCTSADGPEYEIIVVTNKLLNIIAAADFEEYW